MLSRQSLRWRLRSAVSVDCYGRLPSVNGIVWYLVCPQCDASNFSLSKECCVKLFLDKLFSHAVNMCKMSTEFASNHVLLQYDFCNHSTMLYCLCLCVTKPRRITIWCGHPPRIDRMGSVACEGSDVDNERRIDFSFETVSLHAITIIWLSSFEKLTIAEKNRVITKISLHNVLLL